MPKIRHDLFYLSSLEKHGTTPKGLGWNSYKNQQIRFEKLLDALPSNLHNTTVVDAGCGFGDLFLYLKKHNRIPKNYIGIESLERFASIAEKRTKRTIVHADILRDPLPKANYYLISGALNTLTKFETLLFLRRCLEHANKGVVFNCLYGDKESDVYNYIDKNNLLSMIKKLNAKLFYHTSGYIENDITVGICAQSLE